MGRKWINSLNVRFPRVGGDKTPLSTDWSNKNEMVPSCHQQNKSSPLGILYGKYWVLIAEICTSNLQLRYPFSLFFWRTAHFI